MTDNNVKSIINKMTITQRKDIRFEGKITINGKRKSFYGKTKKEVKDKAKEYLMKVENGYKESEKILLCDYMDYWLKKYKYGKIEPSSYTRLYSVYIHQIKDTIGQMYIGDVTGDILQKFIDNHADPKDSETKALAESGLKRLTQLLKPCFKRAVSEGVIWTNPCTELTIPSESYIQVETKVATALSDSQIKVFKEACLHRYEKYGSRDALVLLIMLSCGLRVGEMLALEWSDIDFEQRLIRVHRTIQSNIMDFSSEDLSTYDRVKSSTKTKKVVRSLAINDTVLDYLLKLKNNIPQVKNTKNPSPYVACTSVGTRQNARNLQRSLTKIIQKANIVDTQSQQALCGFGLHDLRHTFGSAMLRHGIGIEVLSKLMGHANITITYNKYIHVLQEQQALAMQGVTIC